MVIRSSSSLQQKKQVNRESYLLLFVDENKHNRLFQSWAQNGMILDSVLVLDSPTPLTELRNCVTIL
jgi:hypothetical protein